MRKILLILVLACSTLAWGADQTISVEFNSTNKPQNGINLIAAGITYGTVSCNTASSNRAIIRNTSSLTIAATREGWTISSITLTWRGSNDPTSTDVLTITGGTFNSLTSITGTASTVVIGSSSNNNNYQISGVSVVFTEAATCSATAPGNITKGTVSGGTITLTAEGSPATGNTWYWQTAADGTDKMESGETKDVNAAGTYYIRSYYDSEDCWSAAKSIVVNAEDFLTPSSEPVITTHPVSATYEVGETVLALSVTASGSGDLSYQWQRDGADIPSATSNNYLPTASGSYTCVVTNKEAGKAPCSVTSSAAVIVIKSNSYYLQGISGTAGTNTLTGDFYTGADLSKTVSGVSHDGVSYTKGISFDGNVSSWGSNFSYHNRMIRYDCKSTRTDFTIIAYNDNTSAKNMYIGDIKEEAIGTANTISSLQAVSVSGKEQLVQTYTITNDKVTPASLYITVASTDVTVVQVIAEEKGTPLPVPGSVGYKVNFYKARVGVRQDAAVWLDSPDFVYCPGSNTAAGTATFIPLKEQGKHYIKFRALEDCFVNIAISNIGKGLWLADDQSATVNVSDLQNDGEGTYSLPVTAGVHYITPNLSSSTTQVTSLEFSAAVRITFNANGGIGTMSTQLVPAGQQFTLPASEFSKPGYIFGGWTEDAGGTGPIIADEAIITPSGDVTLYAKWADACEATPILKLMVDKFTIWNEKEVDMTLMQLICKYDTTTVKYSLKSVSENINGCSFKFYNAQIHLVGKPTGYTTSVTKNITFTLNNNCSPESTFNITIPIQIHPTSRKPKIAYIVTGTKGGDFSDYNTANETSSSALLAYLSTYYDVTCVNGYATKDPDAIAVYYDQYDLLIVTDYMETPEGYTNAIGTLIDKKPILSFEAYVAGKNGSNWHIGSNPVDPSPKVKDMKVLCAGHSVFGGGVLESDEETVKVLSSTSGKGLQGFVINEAPDFLFLATIHDENGGKERDLIVCCERQMVFPARLMLYGINYNEMGNITANGKLAMKQMIDYLLLTDETKVADCALVFDNKAGDHKWSTPGNWAPGYNIVPTPYHPTRIIAPCNVDIDNAHASSVKINVGKDHLGDPLNGQLTILPQGGLVVAGFINKVVDTRWANLLETSIEDIVIQANASNNGALVFGNKETDVRATVQYYSRGEDSDTHNPVWQYIGIPLQAEKTAIAMYYEAWMCRWAESSGLGGLWQWVRNEDILVPFEGYCITQQNTKTYTLQGKLNGPISRTLKLNVRDADGYAFAANSWTAPIKVNEMADDDFINADRTIYIYHTGSFDDYGHNGDPVNAKTEGTATLPGQYAVIPIHSAPYIAGADSVIPAMQGFFVRTTGTGARLNLVYNRVVYDSKFLKTTASPTRAPKHITESTEPDVMHIGVFGAHGADRVHLLARADFSEEFADGWDGHKISGDTAHVPMLAVVKEAGEMAVAVIPSFEARFLSFRAGEDTEYTFSFEYEGEEIYLYDLVIEQATLIRTGNTYTFSAVNKTPQKRFLITANPPHMPQDIENVDVEQVRQAEKFIQEGQLRILHHGIIYDALGDRIRERKEARP